MVHRQLEPVLRTLKTVDFGGFKLNAKSFIDYFISDFGKKLDEYEQKVNASSVRLVSIVPAKHRHFFLEANIRVLPQFLRTLISRKDDFTKDGKENNYIVACSFYIFYIAFITKLIDVYFNARIAFSASGSTGSLKLSDLGIDNTLLKYFESMADLREKSVDDWLNASFEDKDVKYITSSMKRIFLIMGYKK